MPPAQRKLTTAPPDHGRGHHQHHGSGHREADFITDDEDLLEGSALDIDAEDGSGEVEGSGESAGPPPPRRHPAPPAVELDPFEQQRVRTEFYELHHADMYRLDQ